MNTILIIALTGWMGLFTAPKVTAPKIPTAGTVTILGANVPAAPTPIKIKIEKTPIKLGK